MPLTGNPAQDIPELQAAGHKHVQAVAIALKEQRKHRADQEGPCAEQFPAVDAVGGIYTPAADVAPIAPGAGAGGRAAGILFVAKNGQMLFVQRGDGGDYPHTWAPPGGHQEPGETLEACAIREALEETGYKHDGPLQVLLDNGQFCTYLARVDEPFEVKVCSESTGFTWCAAGNCPAPLHPGVPDAIRVLAADTELACAELIRDGVLRSPHLFHRSGAAVLLVDLRITGTGMAYRSKLKEHVWRDASNYLNREFLARCNGLPLIMEHPTKKVLDPKEFEDRIAGMCMLPYLKGEEVWGVFRVYSSDAIERIRRAVESDEEHKPLSTSPGVVFDANSENVRLTMENGGKLLIEGKPALIDHLAICDLGVWDKGGPPTGANLSSTTIEDLAMADDDKISKADAEKMVADAMKRRDDDDAKRRSDAEEKAKADTAKAVADALKARDDDDAKKKADAEKAEEERKAADKKKADEDEKAKADEAAQCKADSEAGRYADAQARADSVYGMLGEQAPRPMEGETLKAYDRRLLRGLQKHSTALKDVDLAKMDDAGFNLAKDRIFADASTAANTPTTAGDGVLRHHTRITDGGHRVTTYSGDPFGWMGRHMLEPRYVRSDFRAIGRELSRP